MNKRIIVLIGLIFFVALAFWLFAQEVELIFSHKFHAEEVEAECSNCHQVATSNLPADNLLPNMESCYSCHSKDEECSVCHKDPDNAIEYPRITGYIAKFSHQQHISAELTCDRCHQGVAASENILDKHLPNMATCTACHQDEGKADYCMLCHQQRENLKPADHNLAWKAEHGLAVNTEENSCNACHRKEYCVACHQQDNLDHKVHPLNFVQNHGMYAKGNKDNCYTCHEEQVFCLDCHQKNMVMPRTHSVANWSNTTTGGAHARAAKLDLDNCLSCHSDNQSDPVCVLCHQK